MKEHDWPITEAKGTKGAVRVETKLVKVSDDGKPPRRRRWVKFGGACSFEESF